ncbi:hypothetical protein [Rhodococcus sp. NPDC057529]|uniref:hypothetical protein n=1 Tax=Rhodococcus sp. NPDC057529 TaxID=3346158 RepID=UPI00366EDDD7
MTAAVPHSSCADDRTCSSDDSNDTRKQHGLRLPAASIVLGTLSVASFWVVGLGFILGIAAVICGAVAASRNSAAEDEAASLRALLGVVAGAAGITVSAIALLPMLSHL